MTVRLYAILARDADRAIVFRRGPSKRVLVIRWNTADDTFEEGQWFKGRIYERRCDLSPDGELLVYFAANYRKPYFSWSAISRPPFLTALALWPKGDAWGGGGQFKSSNHLLLNHRANEMQLAEDFSLSKRLKVDPFGKHSGWGEDNPVWSERLERDGWILAAAGSIVKADFDAKVKIEFDPPVTWEKVHPIWPHRYTLRMSIGGLKERRSVVSDRSRSDRRGRERSREARKKRLGGLVGFRRSAVRPERPAAPSSADVEESAGARRSNHTRRFLRSHVQGAEGSPGGATLAEGQVSVTPRSRASSAPKAPPPPKRRG